MDEPGDDEEIWIMQMIPKFIFVGAAITILLFFAYFFTINTVTTDNLEMNVFFNRLIYSTSALTYYDQELGRTYFGTIDLKKLNSKNIEESISYPSKNYFAANITLQGKEPVYYNKELFENLKPLRKLKGPGSAKYSVKEIRVSYEEDNKIKTGLMKIEILKTVS
ncbi:MAG: hypothetical protein KKF89_05275 [Nanoarchaeota archaeon]|nr:hypothetical protein [Nanoarchaeota archaeon]MBU1855106.1 hypothetical protein [Nanoarchaeota archaeon]